MQSLDAAGILELWERAEPLVGLERALELAAASRDEEPEAVAELPLGHRDAAILELYETVHGRTLEASTRCGRCGELVEFSLDTRELAEVAAHRSDEALVRIAGLVLACRPPTSTDLRQTAAAGTVADVESALLARCVTATTDEGKPVSAGDLPAAARRAAARAIAEADPLCEVLVETDCAACGEPLAAVVDLPAFAWSDLHERARALLRDVDALARAYGWSEPQVVGLSAHRRAAYLDLIGAGSP